MSSFNKKDDEKTFNTPQKKYIRNYIWALYANEWKRKENLDYVRYLTFTSAGCHDILVFKNEGLLNVIEADDIIQYKSVTFCEKDIQKYALIEQQLPYARGIRGSFENMIGAYGEEIPLKAQQCFPFDVINLDFTSPMFSSEKSVVSKAIKRTFEIQKLKHTSFSFFLTLPVKEKVDVTSGKQLLDDNLKRNLANKTMSQFKSKFIETYPDIDINSDIYVQINYVDYLLLSIPKMIISMGFNQSFDVTCNKRFSYIGDHYDGTMNSTKMVKFVFECKYVGQKSEALGFDSIDKLHEIYPKRVLDFFTESPIDINELFVSNDELKIKCCELEF